MTTSEIPVYPVTVTYEDGMWAAVVGGLPPGVFAGFEFETADEVRDGVQEGVIDLLGHNQFKLTWPPAAPL